MEEIIAYLKEKYDPVGLIVYGSFANGTNNRNSDFDALLICGEGDAFHDHSLVGGTVLDVFGYPQSAFAGEYIVDDFIRVWDGRILLDKTGLAAELKEKAAAQVRDYSGKSAAEKEQSLAWCEKMLSRTERMDMEGRYRMHWLLTDSLEIYYDLKGLYYFGPKKAIRQMEASDRQGAELYDKALTDPSRINLENWIGYLKTL